MSLQKFNVRVYGILENNNKQVLVCDELIKNFPVTKFPGGGLEFGEGTVDCLKREFFEELGIKIKVKSHFYTTDFFVPSAFNNQQQILSIYYKVDALEEFDVQILNKNNIENITFYWIDIDKILENSFTLPIDKFVGKMLAEQG